VVFGNEQHAPRIRAHAFDGRLHGLHAKRHERGVQVIEAAGEEVRVDRRELEAGVANVDRGVERNGMLLPVRPEPALDVGHAVEDAPLEVLQRAGQRGREAGDHYGEPVAKGDRRL